MTTRTPAIDAIQKVLNHYIDAVLHGKADLVRPLFHPQALMSGYMNGHLVLGTPAPFLADVEHGPAQATLPHGYCARVLSIDVHGETATALLAEDRISVGQPDGSRIVVDIVDSFHLLHIKDRWLIVSKLFHHDPA
ncbi:nuclear transport factor 2 family protein [Burkholderia multivorans]|uniref:nuclear transport factor 2 family protein n=1 Tax=Burkholderia multivorans TaxID=87883 RepID=UPI002ED3ECA1|nr:nuclear transport factor 2 family protein [Burkholderia multivorans]